MPGSSGLKDEVIKGVLEREDGIKKPQRVSSGASVVRG
jgi:hypothetical protein